MSSGSSDDTIRLSSQSPELASFLKQLTETERPSASSESGDSDPQLEHEVERRWQALQRDKRHRPLYASHEAVAASASPGENLTRLGVVLGFIGVVYCIGAGGADPYGVLHIVLAVPFLIFGYRRQAKAEREKREQLRKALGDKKGTPEERIIGQHLMRSPQTSRWNLFRGR